jgi:hypothetical protein
MRVNVVRIYGDVLGNDGITSWYTVISGLGSVVGIVTGYGLDGSGIESQWG